MSEYQVLARRYRPQTFKEILGQDVIVSTLKNAIKHQRLAHAYLFCGSRGTGKTTIARVFAKALNCLNLNEWHEPCGTCASCREIASGNSLDVLEIDGASHRGIDDIRQINETVGYAASSGRYKIYIIDEVHMLTKEAFNALLKTLEEPPAKVKFFFATTEPHKVLPTILSRCQRFNLKRIPNEEIFAKLKKICEELDVRVDDEGLQLLAYRAEGGLRDAESMLDQMISFCNQELTKETIASSLGIVTRDFFFRLDRAVESQDLKVAFSIADEIFEQGKDFSYFIENLTDHYRYLLSLKIGVSTTALGLTEEDQEAYTQSAAIYTEEQCVIILEFLTEALNQIRFVPSPRIALEGLLLKIIRIKQRVSVDLLLKRLVQLEKAIESQVEPVILQPTVDIKPSMPSPAAQIATPSTLPPLKPKVIETSLSIDPEPTLADFGRPKAAAATKTAPKLNTAPKPQTHTKPAPTGFKRESVSQKTLSRYDTILHFTAVELEGIIQKNV